MQSRVVEFREVRMWTQGRLAEEAGISPTTVSGIESGRISRPHFGTVTKLTWALGVEPRELLSARGNGAGRAPLSLGWAMSSREEEFEDGLEGASLGGLLGPSWELGEEHERLRRLYGEARGAEQRRGAYPRRRCPARVCRGFDRLPPGSRVPSEEDQPRRVVIGPGSESESSGSEHDLRKSRFTSGKSGEYPVELTATTGGRRRAAILAPEGLQAAARGEAGTGSRGRYAAITGYREGRAQSPGLFCVPVA